MQSLFNNFNIKNYLDLIKIKKGDKILLSSDILKILIKFREKKNALDPNIIINFFSITAIIIIFTIFNFSRAKGHWKCT